MKLTLEELPADLSAVDQLLGQHAKKEKKTLDQIKSELWQQHIGTTVPQNLAEKFSEFWRFYQLHKTSGVTTFDRSATTPIQIAAKYGYDIFLQKLCSQPRAEVNAETPYKWTAAHFSALNGNLACLRVLISKGADLDLELEDSRTCLHLATSYRHTPIIKELLDSKYFGKVAAVSNKTGTALHSAILNNNQDAIRLLLPQLVTVKDLSSNTPLHSAVYLNNPEVLDLVLPGSASTMNAINANWETPLAQAVNQQSKVAIEKLLAANASCDLRERVDKSPLYLAFEIYYTKPAAPNAKEIRNLVLQKAVEQGFDLQKLVEPLSRLTPANPVLIGERDQFVNSLNEQAAILSGTTKK